MNEKTTQQNSTAVFQKWTRQHKIVALALTAITAFVGVAILTASALPTADDSTEITTTGLLAAYSQEQAQQAQQVREAVERAKTQRIEAQQAAREERAEQQRLLEEYAAALEAERIAAEQAEQQRLAAEQAERQRQAAATTTTVYTPPPAPTPPAATGSVWDDLAWCESRGNWAMNSGNGFYGGLQFMHSTWLNMGGAQHAYYPHEATREQQIEVATRLQAQYGWGQWPACSAKLGLR